MSYLTQMLALTVQNFVSAATGMAVLALFIRGIAVTLQRHLEIFGLIMTRSTLYILLPLAIVLSLVLVSQGVIQNNSAYALRTVPPIDNDTGGVKVANQVLAMGPAVLKFAIKTVGYQTAAVFSMSIQLIHMRPNAIDRFLRDALQFCLFLQRYVLHVWKNGERHSSGMVNLCGYDADTCSQQCFWMYSLEGSGNPKLTALGVDQQSTSINPGGNMEARKFASVYLNSAVWRLSRPLHQTVL